MVAGILDRPPFSSFSSIWCVDFEFRAPDGERLDPVCLVARELHTGQLIRIWRDELLTLAKPPYPTGTDSLFVAFFASAELGCHTALGWPMPKRILDLYVEHRAATNGLPTPLGRAFLAALAHHGVAGIDAREKTAMRDLILSGGPWDAADRAAILDYCQSDIDALTKLLPAMGERLARRVLDLGKEENLLDVVRERFHAVHGLPIPNLGGKDRPEHVPRGRDLRRLGGAPCGYVLQRRLLHRRRLGLGFGKRSLLQLRWLCLLHLELRASCPADARGRQEQADREKCTCGHHE